MVDRSVRKDAMLDCKKIDELMMDWLYQELPPTQSSPFDAHVAKCARCQAELAGMTRTREALRELPQVEPPPSIIPVVDGEYGQCGVEAGVPER